MGEWIAVKCKCGEEPEMDKVMNLEGPQCGVKDAPWRRSQLAACSDWESKYHSL